MEMEPRLQQKATGSIMLKFVLLSKRLIVIWRIIWAYIFESENRTNPNTRLRTHAAETSRMYMNIITYAYIFSCKVEMNPSQFILSASLTRMRKN